MPRWSAQRLKILYATFVGNLDTNALLPVIALYAISLGADALMTGVIVGAYSMAHAPANVVFGRLIDRIGRRIPLAAGLSLDAIAVALYGLVTTPLALIAVRLFHGTGGGLVGPASMSLIAEETEPRRQGRAMALYGMSIAVAVIFGIGLATAFQARGDYGSLFRIVALLVASGAVVTATVRESGVPAREPFDWSRLRRFLGRPTPLAGYAAIFSLYWILGAFVTLVPEDITVRLGRPDVDVGIALLIFGIVSVLAHYPGGVLSDRAGPWLPATLGLGLIAVSMAFLSVVPSYGLLIPLMVAFGAGHGFVFPAASHLVAGAAERWNLGVATGLFYSILVAGVAVGAPVMAAVSSAYGLAVALWSSSFAVLLGLLVLWRREAGGRTAAAVESPR